jgi:hypothetical protein
MDYKISLKLTEILNTFNNEDIKRFRKFLKSPFLNPYPKVNSLFIAIMSLHPDFPNDKMNRPDIFKKMKTGKKYNDSTMRDLLSKLKFLLDKYLAYSSFENNEFDYLTHLRGQMYKRKLHNQIDKNIADAENLISRYVETDENYFYRKIKIENEKFNNLVINKRLQNKQQIKESLTALNNSAKNLLALFILETIKQNDTILKITKRQQVEKNTSIVPQLLKPINMKEVIVTLKKNESSLSHVFQIYYYLYMLFSAKKNEQYYPLYKENIIASSGNINSDEMHFLFGRLIDYCVNKCNEGRSEYYTELFNSYKIMLENRYYTNSSNKYISQDLFRNIFLTTLRVNNLDWAGEFISKYTVELHPQHRENMYYYCSSYLQFEKSEFSKSLESASKIKQDYFALKTDVKILQLKIYYELGLYEEVYAQVDSFKHFITNNEQIIPSRKKKIKDFIRYYEKLLRVSLNHDRDSAAILNNELMSKDDRQFFDWLIKKTEMVNSAASLRRVQAN